MRILFFLMLLASGCRTLGGFTPPVNTFSGLTVANDHSLEIGPSPRDSLSDKDLNDIQKTRKEKVRSHDNNDFSFFLGRYVDRQGILKDIGDMGNTLGFELAVFSPFVDFSKDKNKKINHGWFILWTLDHVDTNGNLLKPEFKDLDYTNYMLGGGYAFRWIMKKYWQLHYRGGLAVNFLEIDTFRSNGDTEDQKYTDTTVSTIHKLGFDYKIKSPKDPSRDAGIRIGPSLFYYYAPDLLGKFSNRENTPGGSLAFHFDIVFEIY